ncbi:MAG: SpoIID/LytB domain-containing protein [Phycisphaerae bacterium]|nr:SpoIID/LytB domain-containing protein [Phycisphaerae bacterium]
MKYGIQIVRDANMKINWRATVNRYAPLIPILMMLVACGAASLILSSCGDNKTNLRNEKHQPLCFQGVPTIRVRLTSSSVSKAVISTSSPYKIFVDGNKVGSNDQKMPKTTVRRKNGLWILGDDKIPGKTLTIEPTDKNNGLVGFDKRLYRGKLVLIPAKDNNFYVHNNVNFESYVAGVVPKELYAYFHPETYRAQAVAARTYALYEMVTRGKKSSFDVWATQISQVYQGMLYETDKAWDAVRKTHGWVLAYGPEGEERIFLSQFSASNGGYVNGAYVIRDGVDVEWPPLQGGQHDGMGKDSPRYSWHPVRLRKTDIYNALAKQYSSIRKLGNMKTLRVQSKTDYGRPIFFDVVNRDGKSVKVRAENLRLCMLRSKVEAAKKLYSMNCQIRDIGDAIEFYAGTGYGHGVGMSQWGAEDRAKSGQSAEKILEFYYPGAKILRAY